MSLVVSTSEKKPYGVKRVCEAWRMSTTTVHRHLKEASETSEDRPPRRRPGPVGAMPEAALIDTIRQVIEVSPFHGEGYRKVHARLRYKGICTSRVRVLRLMRENGLLAKSCRGPAHGPRSHDGTIIPSKVDEMWGTDMTTTALATGKQVAVFVAIDHRSAACVGLHAAERGTRFEALQPIRQGVQERFGAIGEGAADGLTLRHDNGSQYVSHDFQDEIRWLGIDSSPSFVRSPEGNGCAERFIRTLKENLLWLRTYSCIDDLQRDLQRFKEKYNEQWLIERHGHRSPSQFASDEMGEIPIAA